MPLQFVFIARRTSIHESLNCVSKNRRTDMKLIITGGGTGAPAGEQLVIRHHGHFLGASDIL